MKYDILTPFRKFLNSEIKNKNTADRYYQAVNSLFRDAQFDGLDSFTQADIEERLKKIKSANAYSAAKNGLLWLKRFDDNLQLPPQEFFKKSARGKRKTRTKPNGIIRGDTVTRKINALRDKKLKLAYRLILASGLRVSEAAALEKGDIAIDGEEITINVRHGKGGSNGMVKCRPDTYLADQLKTYLADMDTEERPFYAAETMIGHAGELGIECHDLRRMAAVLHRQESIAAGMSREKANTAVQQFLRHTKFETTRRYLFGKKLIWAAPALSDKLPKKQKPGMEG